MNNQIQDNDNQYQLTNNDNDNRFIDPECFNDDLEEVIYYLL
jgi:hypothetical protein